MGSLLRFVFVGTVFEILALFAVRGGVIQWVVYACILVVILYALVRILNRVQMEVKTDLPPSMHGRVLKRRHWRLF